MSTPAKSAQFLLLFRHSQEGPDPTPQEMEQIMGKWMAWMKGMQARGELAGVNRLQETGKVLRGPGGANVTDGPFVEAKEVVGGYVLVNARDLAAATAIARGCPGLDMNTTIVEVRQVEPLPSNG
jgi:hypothetical protein